MGLQAVRNPELRQLPQLSPAWRPASAAAQRSDRLDGARAASRGMDADTAVETFTHRLVSEGARELGLLRTQCTKILDKSRIRREQLQKSLEVELATKLQASEQRHDDEIARLRRELGPDSNRYAEAASRAEQAADVLRDVRWHLGGRPLETRFRGWYLVIMTILALLAFILNRAALEMLLSQHTVVFFILGVAAGFALMVCAHLIGVILRVHPQAMTSRSMAGKLLGATLLGAAVALGFYVMARMRQSYTALLDRETLGFAARLQEALQGRIAPASDAIPALAHAAFGASDWVFIAANLVLFAAGVLVSYLRHDPDPGYEKVVVAADRAERRLTGIRALHDEKALATTRQFLTVKRDLDAQSAEIRTSLAMLQDQEAFVQEHMEGARGLVALTIRTRCGSFAEGFNEAARADTRAASVPTISEISRRLGLEAPAHAA